MMEGSISSLGNFQSCCRLCLSEKLDDLKSVYDEAIEDRSLPQKISHFLSIEINNPDRLSTLVCSKCVSTINTWQEFKIHCSQNQIKLEEWFHRKSASTAMGLQPPLLNGFGDHLQIKTEPMGDDDGMSMPLWVKSEPVDHDAVDAVYNEFPPTLSPTVPEKRDSLEDRTCTVCHKEFSSANNRKKHEKQLHGKNQPMRIEQYIRKSMMEIETNTSTNAETNISTNAETTPSNETDGDAAPAEEQATTETTITEEAAAPPPAPPTEAEQQKILFAAGLKLLQKNATPISCENLSKIELSYIEKCKAMLSMHKTLECACHNVQHANIKGLLSHLRALRIWFPVFTCYNCMITFTDRSTFTRHNVRCTNSPLDTLTKLSNLKKRSEVKTRLYQNFKCTACFFMYSFHEDFCKHVDEDHAEIEMPYTCSCTRSFDNLEDYKDHVYVSCMVEYYCDICFITTKTLEDFQKHAVDTHDSSEGFILLQDDNYKMRKPPNLHSPKDQVDESVILTGKRERRMSIKAPQHMDIDDEEEDDKDGLLVQPVAPVRYYDPNIFGGTPRSFNKTCPICAKEYSSYNNMMRHYKSHPEAVMPNGVADAATVQDDDGSFYSCPDCGGVYNSKEWQEHLSTPKHAPKSCSECDKIFQFQTELDQHRSVHLNLKVYRDSKTHALKTVMISPTHEDDQPDDGMMLDDNASSIESNATAENVTDNDDKSKKYYCQPCDKLYFNYNSLWDHNKRKHSDTRPVTSDKYPKQCPQCDRVLQTAAAYGRHKIVHDRPPLDAGGKAAAAMGGIRKDLDNDSQDESYHTCNKCFKVFSSRYNLKNHLKTHGIRMTSPTSRRSVIKKEVMDEEDALDEGEFDEHAATTSSPMIFTCDVCVMTFTTKMALKKHKETHLDDEHEQKNANIPQIYCKYCKITFNSLILLNKHLAQAHPHHNAKGTPPTNSSAGGTTNNKKFSCHICKKAFQTAPALATHVGWHKRGGNVTLLNNSSIIGTPTGKVLRTSIGNNITAAAGGSSPTPPATPNTTTALQQQRSNNNQFKCQTCSALLPNDTALQVHILEKHRSVSAIMLIPRCNTCNQDFNTQDEYETHKRLHDFLERQKQHEEMMQSGKFAQVASNVAPPAAQYNNTKVGKSFPCQYCPAGFSRADTLGAHIRQCHKEHIKTEFRCTECDRVFEKSNSLAIHMKMHNKQKAVAAAAAAASSVASAAASAAASNNSVTLNTASSNSKPLFCCSICSMGFDLPKDLRAHTISAHPF